MTSTNAPPTPDTPAAPDTPALRYLVSIPTLAKGFTILVCLVLILVDARNIWHNYTAHLHAAELSVQNVAHSVAQHAGDTIKKADIVLFDLLYEIERAESRPERLQKLQPLLSERAAQVAEVQYFSIIDKNGNWLLNSLARSPGPLDFGDREYFYFHSNNLTNEAHVSLPILSRTTRDWILPVSRRINAPDGSFGGVVLAAIRMSYLNSYYDSFMIGNNGVIALVQTDGTVLMRRSMGASGALKTIAGLPFFRDRVSRNLDGIGTSSDYDGIERVVAFRRLENYPLIAITGESTHEVLANWRAETVHHVIGILILLFFIALLGHYLVKQLRGRARLWGQLVEAQKKLITLNSELERLALQDSLTGLANRRQFDAALTIEFRRAVRKKTSLALLMIDVDHFKRFNDEYGHPAGDRCLQAVSGVIHLQRPGDLSARYGGEEFAILLPDTDLAGAITVAQQIRLGTRGLQIPHVRNVGGVVTLSIGVACMAPERDEPDPLALVQAADTALYEAKASGRDRVMPDLAAAPDGSSGPGKVRLVQKDIG